MAVSSQDSIDSINDTIVTQPKPSQTNTPSLSASEKILNGTISSGSNITKPTIPPSQLPGTNVSSSFDRSSIIQQPDQPPIAATYETYRPPISHERINPFDKNKATTTTGTVSNVTYSPYSTTNTYSSSSTITSSTVSATKESQKTLDDIAKDRYAKQQQQGIKNTSTSFKSDIITSSGFDYSYKPPPLPTIPPAYSSIDKADPVKSEEKPKERPEFQRKLSDADIVFGAKPVVVAETTTAASSYKFGAAGVYGRNRSNSSFTSTSTDSDFIYSTRDSKRENSFQKSLSVSSDKDGDFAHDPTVLATRSGISNDAFSDYDSPSKTASLNKSWSNNDDEYDLK